MSFLHKFTRGRKGVGSDIANIEWPCRNNYCARICFFPQVSIVVAIREILVSGKYMLYGILKYLTANVPKGPQRYTMSRMNQFLQAEGAVVIYSSGDSGKGT